ncbi:hypothetical protein Taci_1433 [Thermanaerovibrio acidaminovorans DSM 6589]|uniref:DUF3311 domain-containing protein n=1 Tax=Thermanaerovibrio acidaminovorans (strain ATCC 49978 / DSM 6589 / Su883) TaxID=525903 RepID=D1B6M2_THEAS|nr:DUF3311 domain-containing protein [Thermanaerovibrio acidaminovorans]ACZ19663.1 hypothetical protein Taci_1433 [Thermanaerovibrio acidaminovorans DSM 6589]
MGVKILGLTRGERRGLVFLVLAVLGFMPPVTWLANRLTPMVLGMPFLLFWQSLMILFTSLWIAMAYWTKERGDGR